MSSTNGDTAPFEPERAAPVGALDVLERFRRARPRPGERCELCAAPIADEHDHVVDVANRSLLCACRPCSLLFLPGGAGAGQYRAVPTRVVALAPGTLSRGDWETFQIPVGMAFFFFSSLTDEVHAFYPGPAGATESLLPLDVWNRLRDASPVLATLEADVEALLVRDRAEGDGTEGDPVAFLVPIDACYELVGHLRMTWRGFDGGTEARRVVDDFFEAIRRRAKPGTNA